MSQTVLIMDFGGQYKELIARRVRECGVYSIIKKYDISPDEVMKINPIGIILTGGPNSVYDDDAPVCSEEIFSLNIPVLGICYGMHVMCRVLGGTVVPCDKREYGRVNMEIVSDASIFEGLEQSQQVLMSHSDMALDLPDGFVSISKTKECANAAIADTNRTFYGTQFHPEVENTINGQKMIHSFLFAVCKAEGDYSIEDYLNEQIEEIRDRAAGKKVLLALSGGVDSSVCAAIISKAIGDRLYCIFVDHGLMRKNEGDEIERAFSSWDLNFIRSNSAERFLTKLKGVTDPEEKRKIIGSEFVAVFDDEANKLKGIEFLAQGTIYPDVIESGIGDAATIKSHHNVGGLPKDLKFEGVIEPLRGLFKDEVRKIGRLLSLPDYLVNRQPFPGPGLAIRVLGEVTEKKLNILRDADAILREEIINSEEKADQYFAVLTNCQSVGVMGDGRTYDYTLALRAVLTNDFMTCEYAHLSHRLLSKISTRITNEVKGINRVVFDITDKPPATIEWE